MYIEFHDSEEGNTLVAKIKNLDYEYQAEQWVIDAKSEIGFDIVECRLFTDAGNLIWSRKPVEKELSFDY